MGIEAGFPYLSLDAGMYGNYKLRARGDASSFVSAKVVENLACNPHHSASFDEALNATMVSGDGTYIPPPRPRRPLPPNPPARPRSHPPTLKYSNSTHPEVLLPRRRASEVHATHQRTHPEVS